MASPHSAHPSRETLSEYHDGELDASVRPEVRRHILECAACRDYLDDLTSGSRLYQRLPARRPPTSMRREMYQRIDAHQRRSWPPFPFPAFGGHFNPNVVGLAVATVLLAFLVPQLVGIWSTIVGSAGHDPQRAAQVASPPLAAPAGSDSPGDPPAPPADSPPEAPLVEPRVTVVPPTAVPPSPTNPPPPTATGVPARPSATPRPASPTARPAQETPAASGASSGAGTNAGAAGQGASVAPPTATAPKPAPSPTLASPAPPAPSATASPAQRVVSGQISAVDRRQRLFSVFSADGARTWQVRLADNSVVVQRDGRAISFEDVGLADQVEVSGTEPLQAPGTLTAAAVKVLVSAVAPASGGKVHVLFLVDGADSLRPPQYGYTGDWIKRLNDTGYAVTALEPARISSGRYDLKDFNLIVIGYPATLSPSALQLVTASRKPVLNAEPRLVQPLGLGLNVDPQQPARDLPGRTVEVAGQSSPVTSGLNGETTLAGGRLHRMPIVASGAVLGTLNDGGQKRAVWSVTGTSMYLGFYASDGGQNHNATYWAIFDRSILWLLGRDPTTVPLPGA